MKRIITFLIFANITIGLFAQSDFFYNDKGEKELFKIRKDKVILKANSESEAKALSRQTIFSSAHDINYDMVIVTIDTLQINLDNLKERASIVDASYALEYAGALQYPSYQIFVKFKKGQPIEEILDDIGLTENIETLELFNPNHNIYMITLNVKLGNILHICRNLFESGLCEFAEPSFFREIKRQNVYYPHQWGLKNIGQSGGMAGIDIKAEQAWSITRGSPDIKVAIIDEGVALTHPDLQVNLLQGYDATNGGAGGVNGGPQGGNAHGTACAGVVGAINNTIGVVGVASSTKMVPIRIGYDLYNGGAWTSYDLWRINGIRYAWQTAQADVLSNSWGGGSASATITAEITDAVTLGRNGKGCVVIFAAGNDASLVDYPANLSNVIAVGAIERDGEVADFSNYGTTLDVVAPGVDIYTTGMLGATGYGTIINNGTNGVYFSGFSGTSAACPHVAGVAALVLSANPNLTGQQVRNIIESTCQKINEYNPSSNPWGYTYSITPNRLNGTWNNQMGYGLVNAYAAVQAACAIPFNFTNQTVTTNRTVTGCNINVQNVKVQNNAKLILDAVNETTINGDFEVQLGSEFEIK